MTGPPQISDFDFHGLAFFVDRALLALEGLAWPWRALQDRVINYDLQSDITLIRRIGWYSMLRDQSDEALRSFTIFGWLMGRYGTLGLSFFCSLCTLTEAPQRT